MASAAGVALAWPKPLHRGHVAISCACMRFEQVASICWPRPESHGSSCWLAHLSWCHSVCHAMHVCRSWMSSLRESARVSRRPSPSTRVEGSQWRRHESCTHQSQPRVTETASAPGPQRGQNTGRQQPSSAPGQNHGTATPQGRKRARVVESSTSTAWCWDCDAELAWWMSVACSRSVAGGCFLHAIREDSVAKN